MEPLKWTTFEFEKKEKKPDWFWTVGLIGLLGSTVSFFYGNIFFGIFIIIASIVTIIYGQKHPKELAIEISDEGIRINNSLITYTNIKVFWLDESGKEDKLLLLVRDSFVPTIALPLKGVSAESVRERLVNKVKEEELRESRSVALFDRLGF